MIVERPLASWLRLRLGLTTDGGVKMKIKPQAKMIMMGKVAEVRASTVSISSNFRALVWENKILNTVDILSPHKDKRKCMHMSIYRQV